MGKGVYVWQNISMGIAAVGMSIMTIASAAITMRAVAAVTTITSRERTRVWCWL